MIPLILSMMAPAAMAETTDFHGFLVYEAQHNRHQAEHNNRWLSYPGVDGSDTPSTRTALTHVVVEIWDRDNGSSSNDDFLGYAVTDWAGHFHFQFDWEQDFPQYSESRPDLYVKVRFVGDVHDGWDSTTTWTPGMAYIRSFEVYRNGSATSVVTSFRDHVNQDAGEGLQFLEGNHLGVTHLVDAGEDEVIRRTANFHQATDWIFERSDTPTYHMLDEQRECEASGVCTQDHLRIATGTAWSTWAPGRAQTNFDSDRYREIDMMSHEIGHRWQYLAFEADGDNPGLVFDLTLNGLGHGGNPTSDSEYQSTVLFEGAASFFGFSVRHWFNHPDPRYYNNWHRERDTCEDFDLSMFPAEYHEFWATASLWDLTDSTTWGSEEDVVDMSAWSAWAAFDNFEHGSADRQTLEPGPNHANMYDYWFNWDDRWSGSSSEDVQDALIDNNCLQNTDGVFRPF